MQPEIDMKVRTLMLKYSLSKRTHEPPKLLFLRMKKSSYLFSPSFFFLLLTGTMLLFGCAPSTIEQLQKEKQTVQLKAAEILELVDGNTLNSRTYREDVYLYFDHSGTLFGIDINNNEDTGHWDVSTTDELCLKMQWWWYADLRCFSVYSDSEKYYLIDSSGLIAYTSGLYQGDYKNQYRDLSTEKRKSYRKSILSKTDRSERPAAQLPEQVQPSAPEKPKPSRTGPDVPPAELKSTVKWMARDCPGCNLENADLRKAELVTAKLKGANLAGADLSGANLRRADLQDAILERADLSLANLPGADMRGANLRDANLHGANLIRADLTDADLTGADLEGALLEGIKGLDR